MHLSKIDKFSQCCSTNYAFSDYVTMTITDFGELFFVKSMHPIIIEAHCTYIHGKLSA